MRTLTVPSRYTGSDGGFRSCLRRANADMQQTTVVNICAPQVVACSAYAERLDVQGRQRVGRPDLDQRTRLGAAQRTLGQYHGLRAQQTARIDDVSLGISRLHTPMMPDTELRTTQMRRR